VVRQFGQFLSLVEAGQSVRIIKHGRSVARLVPDRDFMSGKQAAELFRDHQPDKPNHATAQAIAKEVAILRQDAEDALNH
jgi:prevent-host-death family protein